MMGEKIYCKIKNPFRLRGVLYDRVGETMYMDTSSFRKLKEKNCVVQQQDPKTLEAPKDEQPKSSRTFSSSYKKSK